MSHEGWAHYATDRLIQTGHLRGAARADVIDLLSQQDCCLTTREIADALRARGKPTGVASVYRAVELLSQLGLIQRLDIGDGTARYEPADPSGDHHHHLVCDRCGRVTAFEDAQLEQAISALAARVDHAIDAHDVILHGACPTCRPGA
jgi:Fur family transcriptional regulator, ferric uptake regulator